MTLNTPVDSNGPSRDVLAEAMELYTLAAEIFADGLRDLRAGKHRPDLAKDLAGLTKEYRQSLQSVLNERAAIDKLRREIAGRSAGDSGPGGGARELDFGAARDEIGRRLACLRAAGGGG